MNQKTANVSTFRESISDTNEEVDAWGRPTQLNEAVVLVALVAFWDYWNSLIGSDRRMDG
jgi:hypothetical protein